MGWDLTKDRPRELLQKEIEWSRQQLQQPRDNRRDLIDLYVGNRYGSKKTAGQRKQIVNLIQQTANIYANLLAANRPRFKIHTPYAENMEFAKRFEVNLNNLVGLINLEESLYMCVLDSLFKIGIMKVGLGSGVSIQLDNDVYSNPGFPFAAHISLDNAILDMRAKSLRTMRYAGDYYEVEEELIEDGDMFSKKDREFLLSMVQKSQPQDLTAADIGVERNEPPTGKRAVRLMDVWVPCEMKVYTLDGEAQRVVHVSDYEGNVDGPYKYLCLNSVPDNLMPIGQLETLEMLGRLYNKLYGKLSNQAGEQRNVTVFEAGASEDAKALLKARDGDTVMVNDVERVKPLALGGINQQNFAFALNVASEFNKLGGNISTLAGLGASSDTVGQENIIHQQNGVLFSKMQAQVVRFAGEVGKELGWHLWNDQVGMRASVSAEEYGVPDLVFDRSWIPGVREGDFANYNFEVEPYSMAYRSPQERYSALNMILQQMIIPLMGTPAGMQSGLTIDTKEFVKYASDTLNMPELAKIVKHADGMAPPQMPEDIAGGMKPQREYIHRSAKSKSNPEQDQQKQAAEMMSSAGQDNAA